MLVYQHSYTELRLSKMLQVLTKATSTRATFTFPSTLLFLELVKQKLTLAAHDKDRELRREESRHAMQRNLKLRDVLPFFLTPQTTPHIQLLNCMMIDDMMIPYRQ